MINIEDLKGSRRFSHVNLPSKGEYYENGCKQVKVFSLDASDLDVLTDRSLLASGTLLDALLNRKVMKSDAEESFVPPSKMLSGDRLALIMFMRAQSNPMYKIPVKTSKGTVVTDFDLRTLKPKVIQKKNKDGNFNFVFKKSFFKDGKPTEVPAIFRLMTGADEIRLREMRGGTPPALEPKEPMWGTPKAKIGTELIDKLVLLTLSIGGNEDREFIRAFLMQADIDDVVQYNLHMEKCMPGLDLEITVEVETGDMALGGGSGKERVKMQLPFSASLLLPESL
jgi:hypothetical protein